ncbi:MAG: hypothetical protein JNL38_16315 [Myxococcales bacterium]|jgi:hypothetical protein|nr:hypothetical protein [Myxococcales bacterium]
MAPSPEELRALVARLATAPFPHAAEVAALLEGGARCVTLECTRAPDLGDLRVTYQTRAAILAARDLPTGYPPTLAADVRALADALDAAEDQPARIWSVGRATGEVFVVFELERDPRIVGVIKSRKAPRE